MSTPPTLKTTPAVERSWHPLYGRSVFTKRRRGLMLSGLTIVGLLLLFVWLIGRPIQEPQVHLMGLESPAEQLNSKWSVRSSQSTLYSQDLWSSLDELRNHLSAGKTSQQKVDPRLSFAEPPDGHKLLKQLNSVSDASSDLLILFLTTQAINRDGKVMFSWNSPGGPADQWWDSQQLLTALRSHPASLKFVVLDAGQTQWAPQQGILLNDYLHVLKSNLEATHDPSLWFFCSHSTGEISLLDHKRRNSLFNLAVLQGMQGEADLDLNGLISIREMTQYTSWRVDFWSQRYAGYEFRQTPQILWGGGTLDIDSHWPDLIPVVEETSDESEQEPAQDSKQGTEQAQIESVASLLGSEAVHLIQRSVENIPSRFGPRLVPARGMGLPGLIFLWQAPLQSQTPGAAPSATNSSPSVQSPGPANGSAPAGTEAQKLQTSTPPATAAQPAESTDGEEELSESEKALLEAWKIRDRLRGAQEASWTVADRFPLEFRRLEQELVRLDLLDRNSNEANRSAWQRQLTRIVERFRTMETELKQQIPLPLDSDPVERLEQQHPFHTLALRKLLPLDSQSERLQLEQSLTKLLAAFEQENQPAVLQLAADLEPDRQLIEIDLACLLAELPPAVPGPLRKQALQNRIRLEELAARAFGYQSWIRDRFRSTELSLARSESLLLNHIPGTFESEAPRLLEQIAFEIDAIRSVLTTVRETDRVTSELLSQFNEYITLSRLSRDAESGLSPTPGELEELLGLLSITADLLQEPDPQRLPQLARNSQKLKEKDNLIRNLISESAGQLTQLSGSNTSELGWQREAFLRVSLISGPQRRALWSALEANSVTEEDTNSAEFPSLAGLAAPALSPRNVEGMNSHLRLQARLAEFALAEAAPGSDMETLKDLARINTSWGDDVLLSRYSECGLLLEGLYSSAAEKMSGELPHSLTALKAGQTSSRLRGWSTFSRLLSPVILGRQTDLEPSALRFSADLRELLAWQIDRLEQHRSAYGLFYAEQSISAHRRYQRALRMIWPAIPGEENTAPQIELLAPEILALTQSELPKLELVCRNHLDQTFRGVLLLESDRQAIHARFDSPAGDSAISAADLDSLTVTLFPQVTERLEIELAPNSSLPVEILMSWSNRQARVTPLAVTLIGQYGLPQDRSGPAVYTQRTVTPQRSFSDSWALSLREGIATNPGSGPASGLILHPFPGRGTNFAFQLDYLGNRQVRVDVELVEQSTATALNDRQTLLLRDLGLVFSAQNASAPLKWSSPPAGAQNKPTEQELQLQEAPADIPSRPIGRSLLVRVTDQDSDGVAWIPVRVQTQRPRRYLHASASYDREMELVRVNMEPRSGMTLPPGEIPIVCRLWADPETRGIPVEMAGTMSSDNPLLELKIPLEPKIGRKSRLSISADGIDREFIYELLTDRTVNHLPEQLDRSRLEIVSPRSGEAFDVEGSPVELQLEIDLPVADLFLEQNRPIAEIWLDTIPNRTLDPSETEVTIDSERKIKLGLAEPDEEGLFSILTQVADWNAFLPRAGASEGEQELLGRLLTSRGFDVSNPVTIVFDGVAPVLKTRAPDYVLQQEPFPISIVPAIPDSSGIASIDAQIDLQGDGRMTPENTTFKAARTEQDQQWICTIPTKELPPGRYTVLIQAVDAVGHRSEIVSQSMYIVTAEQLQLMQLGEAIPLTGVVLYGKDPVPKATVTLTRGTSDPSSATGDAATPPAASGTTLTVTTDEAGRFRFESVEPGDWTLKASNLMLNRLRTFESPIRVSPPPAPNGIMRLRLR